MGKKQKSPHAEMSFLEHLEALRWHIVRSAVAVLIITIIMFIQKEWLVDVVLFGPSQTDFTTYLFFCEWSQKLWNGSTFCLEEMPFNLLNVDMAGQFSAHIWLSLIAGFIFSFPYIFWEIWRFVRPGLTPKEQKSSRWVVVICSFLFALGVLFAYYLIVPLSVQFLGGYRLSAQIANQITVTSYLTTISSIMLACALLFQLPMVIYFLSRAGLVTPEWMRKYRKHALVVTLILSAIITPPDLSSQILVSIPVLILYEISIFVSAAVLRNQPKDTTLRKRAV